MSSAARSLALAILAVLPTAPGWLSAQRTSATTEAAQPLVIQGQGSAVAVRGERVPPPPSSLSADDKLALARAALGSRVSVSGIGAKLRLTPARPFAASQAVLRTRTALMVNPADNGGQITLQPDVAAGAQGPGVEVSFRPTVANRPILVDFVLRVSSVNAPVGVHLGGSGVQEQRTLAAGDHHVTAVVIPGDTGWQTVSLGVDQSSEYQRVWVYAVELTTLD
jgi:hypothetical protein